MVFNLLPERQKTLTPEVGSKGLGALAMFNAGSAYTTILFDNSRRKGLQA